MSSSSSRPNVAAELLASGQSFDMYQQFKSFQRGESLIDERYRYPEISGYLAHGALVQFWRDQSRPQEHIVALGDLATGVMTSGRLNNVAEVSRHQKMTEDMRARIGGFEPPSALLRDFAVMYGSLRINDQEYEVYASADHIHFTDVATNVRERVGDYIELGSEMYRIRRELAKNALDTKTTSIYKYI